MADWGKHKEACKRDRRMRNNDFDEDITAALETIFGVTTLNSDSTEEEEGQVSDNEPPFAMSAFLRPH